MLGKREPTQVQQVSNTLRFEFHEGRSQPVSVWQRHSRRKTLGPWELEGFFASWDALPARWFRRVLPVR